MRDAGSLPLTIVARLPDRADDRAVFARAPRRYVLMGGMAGKVRPNMSVSVDGFIAGPGDGLAGASG